MPLSGTRLAVWLVAFGLVFAGPGTASAPLADFTPPLLPPAADPAVALAIGEWKVDKKERQIAKLRKANRRLSKRVVALERELEKERWEKLCRRPTTIVVLGRCLQREGLRVSEHPAFGGVEPVHSPGSDHYAPCYCALDVNANSNEMARLSLVAARLQLMPGVTDVIWLEPDHFDHLHVAFSRG